MAKKRNQHKKLRRSLAPPESYVPRRSKDPARIQEHKISFSANRMDQGGRWGWSNFDNKYMKDFIGKLLDFQKYNIPELIDHGSHPIKVEKLVPKARKRLEEISLDTEELFSLRFSGKQRVWCILNMNMLSLLWWDPRHEVCPSHKKHT